MQAYREAALAQAPRKETREVALVKEKGEGEEKESVQREERGGRREKEREGDQNVWIL